MKGFPLNLASQPIEQVRHARRIVRWCVSGLLALALLQAGALWWMHAPEQQQAPAAAVDAATLARWQQQVQQIVQAADVQRARATVTAIQLGRQLVAWRAIAWSALFEDLESVLPERARLELVQPGVDADGTVSVVLVAASPDTGPLQGLLIELERHGSFRQVFPRQETLDPDGLHRITLQAQYVPQPLGPARVAESMQRSPRTSEPAPMAGVSGSEAER